MPATPWNDAQRAPGAETDEVLRGALWATGHGGATQCELITRIPYYPSWIEIPVHDLEGATAFDRTVFGLGRTPRDQELGADFVALLASDKDARAPGVALVKSRLHTPSLHGPVVNFHLGTHAALMAAVEEVVRHGGGLASRLFDAGDGTRFQHVRDCEGNTLALSSWAPPKEPQT